MRTSLLVHVIAVVAIASFASGCGGSSSNASASSDSKEVVFNDPAGAMDCFKSVAGDGSSLHAQAAAGEKLPEYVSGQFWVTSQFKPDEDKNLVRFHPSGDYGEDYGVANAPTTNEYGELEETTYHTFETDLYFFPSSARAKEAQAAYLAEAKKNPNLPDFDQWKSGNEDAGTPSSRTTTVMNNVLISYNSEEIPHELQRVVKACISGDTSLDSTQDDGQDLSTDDSTVGEDYTDQDAINDGGG